MKGSFCVCVCVYYITDVMMICFPFFVIIVILFSKSFLIFEKVFVPLGDILLLLSFWDGDRKFEQICLFVGYFYFIYT